MKKSILKIVILFSVFSLAFISCGEKDEVVDPPIEENTSCMEFENLHSMVEDARHIFFLNEQEGWMIGFNPETLSINGNNMLLHTTDGGHNWSIINEDLKFGAFMYVNSSIFKFQFTDSNNGYLAVDFGMDGYDTDQSYYYTNDKGATWSPVPLPSGVDIYSNRGIGVNSTQMVYLSNNKYEDEDIPHNRLYFVSSTTHSITNEVLLSDDFDYYSVSDIHFANSGVLNMSITNTSTSQLYMAHSEDYGATWTYTEIEYESHFHSYMEFPTDNVGYLTANNIIYSTTVPFYKTTDGGATWIEKTAELDGGMSFDAFAFADENNGLAIRYVGDDLYKTTNGGDSWERISCFTDANYDLDFYTTPMDIAYPAVDKGIILTSWMDIDAVDDIDVYQNRVYFYIGE